jgi:hypothetical protein
MRRLTHAWRAMEPEQRLVALAALGLLVTMFLPWYSLQSLDRKTGVIHSHSISAFGDVSFVEAAIFLVAVGVSAIVFARGEEREFHLPGGDGLIVMIAGGWAALLIFYRVFSRPAGGGYPVGIQWGFFLAFVAAGGLALAGWRMRAAERPEPPLSARPRRPPRRPPSHGDDDITVRAAVPARSRPSTPVGADLPAARPRSRYPPAPGPSQPEGTLKGTPERAPSLREDRRAGEQLSFEDPPARSE